jgi:zinc D-Ala-D-Ala carboxypeptidase
MSRDLTAIFAERWPNFTISEVACPCCGEVVFNGHTMDAIQRLRDMVGKPIRVNSGHRCALHNARVGGAPMSAHRRLAFDIDLRGHDRKELAKAAREAGFTGLGYYVNFLHLDTGRKRFWFGSDKAKKLWT